MDHNLKAFFGTNKPQKYRCYKCGEFMFYYGRTPDDLGIVTKQCEDSRCKAINNVLLFENKCFLIREKLAKHRKMLCRFREKVEELDLQKEQYRVIFDLIK
ncbi:hypothetical protein HY024_00485 [Candidatus Curtissbacteria bacterium]|nr:hypothetical protein [Candidatus Curtissbacteria bacterium]